MPRNGSGTYTLPVGNPVVTGTTISSTWANNTLTDISNALTGSLSADGQTTASGNLNMGTNKIINAGDPTNAQDVATKYYVDELVGALGTMAYQDANNVDITGGDIASVNLDLHSMTNEIYLPVGPTALRTASPINGLMRFNTDAGGFYEGYINGNWQKFVTVNEGSYVIEYIVVAGGGGASAGSYVGGGGGGQLISSQLTAIVSTVFTMIIGSGGAGGVASGYTGTYSEITGIATSQPGIGGSNVGGNSGNGYQGGANNWGGGAGSSAAGAAGTGSGGGPSGVIGGNGGAGTTSVITGSGTTYGGGGGGGGAQSGGSGGAGGGGAGGYDNGSGGAYGINGTINTGGGGGGAGWQSVTYGYAGSGGSGVVILKMPTASYSGTFTGSPTVTTSGSNTILKFISSGTYTA